MIQTERPHGVQTYQQAVDQGIIRRRSVQRRTMMFREWLGRALSTE